MKARTKIWIVAATALALAPAAGMAKGPGGGQGGSANAQVQRGAQNIDRDRARDRVDNPGYQQDRDRIQDQDRIHVPDRAGPDDNSIYGHRLMSVEERNQFREQLRQIGSDSEKRMKFLAEHREKMRARAKAQGIDLDAGNDE